MAATSNPNNRLAKARVQEGLTQEEIAEMFGIHRVTVANYESLDSQELTQWRVGREMIAWIDEILEPELPMKLKKKEPAAHHQAHKK